jgi:hypothetical protein
MLCSVFDAVIVNRFVLKQELTMKKPNPSIAETVRVVDSFHTTSAATPYLPLFAQRKGFRREDLGSGASG